MNNEEREKHLIEKPNHTESILPAKAYCSEIKFMIIARALGRAATNGDIEEVLDPY